MMQIIYQRACFKNFITIFCQFQDVSCQTQKCLGCKSANSQIRQLQNKIIDITKKIEEQDIKIKQQEGLEITAFLWLI